MTTSSSRSTPRQPNRQPAGVPTGGQFAAGQRGRSGVGLSGATSASVEMDADWFEDVDAEVRTFVAGTKDGFLLTVRERDLGYDSGPIQQWEIRHEHADKPLQMLAFGNEKSIVEAKAAAELATTDGWAPGEGDGVPRVDRETWLAEGFLHAVQTSRSHIPITQQVVKPEYWSGFAITRKTNYKGDVSYGAYEGNAWQRPDEQPLLPWKAPEGEPVAFVDMDGRVSAITSEHDPRTL